MLDFLDAPFNFEQGDLIKVRVTAINELGEGPVSAISTTVVAQVETVPHVPTATITVDQASTDSAQIALEWQPLVGEEDGGADITLYNVQWDEGLGTTQYALTTQLAYSYTVTALSDGLTAGFPYKFRYRAMNKYGWGGYSEEASHIAAAIPDQASPVSTTIENSFAKIWWAPLTGVNDGGTAVLEYLVEIRQHDGTYAEEEQYCDGAQTAIVLNAYCFIPVIESLRADPYLLEFQDPIMARVKSRNAIGWSEAWSLESLVFATVEVEPTKMPPVVKGAATDQTQIEIDWTALAGDATGGSIIISYNLEWDRDGTQTTFEELVGQSQSYIQSSYTIAQGITVGESYSFRVRARNKWGFGEFSDPVLLDASYSPEPFDSPPVTTNVGGNIRIEWTAPFDNGAEITKYEIVIE